MADPQYVMIGAGGHARVLQETLALTGVTLAGFIAPTQESRLKDTPWFGSDDALAGLDRATALLVNGVGSAGAVDRRASVHEAATALGFDFATVIDPTAIVRASATIEAGAQVLAGAIVNTDAVVGPDAIVNTRAVVEHDSRIGAHSHVASGATLAGNVTIGERTHVGLGALVIQGISVGSGCVIGAGAVVVKHVADRSLAVGIPARSRPIDSSGKAE